MIGFRFAGFRRAVLRREVFRVFAVFFMDACYRRRPAGSIAG
jgi:hypothetical protein